MRILEKIKSSDAQLALFLLVSATALLLILIPNFVGHTQASDPVVNAATFPKLLGMALLGLSLILFFGSSPIIKDPNRRKITRLTVWCTVLFAFYYFAILIVGIAPASIVAMIGMISMFGYPKLWLSCTLSILLAISLFYFFEHVAQIEIYRGYLFR